MIYLCYRNPNILLFKWLDLLNFNYSVFQSIGFRPPDFFIYNFTNALFMIFAYLFLYVIWGNNKKHYFFYASMITLLGIIYEIATRDLQDIITILITFIAWSFIYIKYLGVRHEA